MLRLRYPVSSVLTVSEQGSGHAEDEAKTMGDEYVSVEHLFLALLRYPSPSMKKLFQEFGITKERFLQALSTVRGNQRVVSDNPEATYDTLNKIW